MATEARLSKVGAAVRFVAFDLDGTLLRGMTVVQALAQYTGHLDEIEELERVTDLAAISALREMMAGWYRALTPGGLATCLSAIPLAPGAEEGFRLLRSANIETAIVSITWEFAVAWFARRLGAGYWAGTVLAPGGRVEHFWPADKARWIQQRMDQLGLTQNEVAAVGDSWGDMEMLRLVGHPFFVGQTRPEGLEAATHLPNGDILELAQRLAGVRKANGAGALGTG